jgi:hypothetical protein
MAFGFIQSTAGGTPGDPSTGSLPGVTAGSLLIAVFFWTSDRSVVGVSDGINGAWTEIGDETVGAGTLAGLKRQMAFVANVGAGSTNVSIDYDAAPAAFTIALHEYSVSGSTPAIDGTPVYDNVSSSTPTTSAIVTTVGASLLFAMDIASGSVSSAGTGYVQRQLFSGNMTEDDLDGGSPGSKTASFNTSGGDQMLGFVAFRDQVGGGPTIQLRPTMNPLRW